MDFISQELNHNRPLNHSDRCDRCGARAYMIAVINIPESSPLLFCVHHGRKSMDGLVLAGFIIFDQSEQLTKAVEKEPELSND